jgi:hypothetical protein
MLPAPPAFGQSAAHARMDATAGGAHIGWGDREVCDDDRNA